MQNEFCSLCRICCENLSEPIREEARESAAQLLFFDIKTQSDSQVTCRNCSTKLRKHLEFKFCFLQTQASVQPFDRDQSGGLLDLTRVYLQNKGIGREVSSKDLVVCRFCLKQVTGAYIALVENQQELGLVTIMMHECFPEQELGTMSGHKVCVSCYEALKASYNFIRSLNVENRIKEEEMEFEEGPELKPMLFKPGGSPNKNDCVDLHAVKEEEESFMSSGDGFDAAVEATVEGGFEDVDELELDDKYKEEADRRQLVVRIAKYAFLHEKEKRNQDDGDGTKEVVEITMEDIVGEEDSLSSFEACDGKVEQPESESSKSTASQSQTTYKSGNCLYKARRNYNLRNQKRTHEKPSEKIWGNHPNLKKHMVVDKTPEITMHKCNLCSYETKRKGDLKRHMRIHKKPSGSTMYKCNLCTYGTNSKVHYNGHLLNHRKPSEGPIYKCNLCSYETKRKSDLKRHKLIHKKPSKKPSEVPMYTCILCSHEAKREGDLTRHMRIHKKPSGRTMYKCGVHLCSYKTKFKTHYNEHILSHRKPVQVPTFKCKVCSYETRLSTNYNRHLLIHKKLSECPMYRCDFCLFETKFKANCKRHLQVHKKPSEVPRYLKV